MSENKPRTKVSMLTQRASFQQWERERVRWSDTDLVGHVNNLTFGAFCETGRCHFVRELVDKNGQWRMMLLPVQLTINFLGEAFWPADIDIGTGVLAVGNTSIRLGQGIFDGERCIGTSDTTIVLIDETTRRPQALPTRLREWCAARMLPEGSVAG